MTGFVANLFSYEVLNGFRNQLAEFQFDESFLTTVFHIFKTKKIRFEAKARFLELVIEKFENGIELLDSQIQSYNFQDPKEFLENIPSSKQEEIVLPVNWQFDDDYVF